MDKTRANLLNAAEALFANQGFDGTSTREIAERSGANLALIKYYFGSKEGLLEALLDERSAGLAEELEAVPARIRAVYSHGPGPHPVIKVYADWMFARRAFAMVVYRETCLPLRPALAAKAAHIRDLPKFSLRDPGLWSVVMGMMMAGLLGGEPMTSDDIVYAIIRWEKAGYWVEETSGQPETRAIKAAVTEHDSAMVHPSVDFGIGVID
ncbi:MAG: hypothetical protein AMXMBFR84_08500 [Candidatus Hydrogenedentota bacterium]